MKQEYVLKKFVKAETAAEALGMDTKTPVSEVFLSAERPKDNTADAMGFHTVYPED